MRARSTTLAAALAASGLLLASAGALGGCDSSDGVPLQPVPLSPAEPVGPAAPGSQMPANHPPVGAPAGGGGGGAGAAPSPTGADPIMPAQRAEAPIEWTVPAAWEEQVPSSTMRVAQWGIPGAGGAGECAIFQFAGGGAVDANLDRWVGQFAQPDGSSSADHDQRDVRQVNGMSVHTIWLTGTFRTGGMMGGASGDHPDYALYGAVVDLAATPVFLKCTGPEATMVAAQPDFDAFVSSFRAD